MSCNKETKWAGISCVSMTLYTVVQEQTFLNSVINHTKHLSRPKTVVTLQFLFLRTHSDLIILHVVWGHKLYFWA